MKQASLDRFAYSPMGTFGRLTIGDFQCFTVERPWQDNKPNVSCIPEGTYPLKLRESPIIKRTTGGAFTKGWEVTDVPDRSLIMLHVGNTMADVEGCIAVGAALGWVAGRWAVTDSRKAFTLLMEALSASNAWMLNITSTRISG